MVDKDLPEIILQQKVKYLIEAKCDTISSVNNSYNIIANENTEVLENYHKIYVKVLKETSDMNELMMNKKKTSLLMCSQQKYKDKVKDKKIKTDPGELDVKPKSQINVPGFLPMKGEEIILQ